MKKDVNLTSYSYAESLTGKVLQGNIRRLALIGTHGIGKTTLIKNEAKKQNIPLNSPGGLYFINGYKTLTALCADLKGITPTTHGKRTTIVFNDCSLLHSSNSKDTAFLKSLFESDDDLPAGYSTGNGNELIDISHFNFIITANGKDARSVHLQAILDRMNTVTLNPTLEEKIELTFELLINSEKDMKKQKMKMIVFQEILNALKINTTTDYTLRTFNKLFEVYCAGDMQLLQQGICEEFKVNARLNLLRQIHEQYPLCNTTEKVNIFLKETGLSRKSFFNYNQKFKEWNTTISTANKYLQWLNEGTKPQLASTQPMEIKEKIGTNAPIY